MFDFHIRDVCPGSSTRTKQDSVRNARCTSCIQRLFFRRREFKEMHARFLGETRARLNGKQLKKRKEEEEARVPWAEPRADCSILLLLLPAVDREMRAAASSQPPTRTDSAQHRRTSVAIKSARFRVVDTSGAWVGAPPARHHLHRGTGSRRRARRCHTHSSGSNGCARAAPEVRLGNTSARIKAVVFSDFNSERKDGG